MHRGSMLVATGMLGWLLSGCARDGPPRTLDELDWSVNEVERRRTLIHRFVTTSPAEPVRRLASDHYAQYLQTQRKREREESARWLLSIPEVRRPSPSTDSSWMSRCDDDWAERRQAREDLRRAERRLAKIDREWRRVRRDEPLKCFDSIGKLKKATRKAKKARREAKRRAR